MTTQSLTDLNRLFPYDFYAELENVTETLYDAPIAEFFFMHSPIFEKKHPDWVLNLKQSVKTRLQLFEQSKQDQENISTAEDFAKLKVPDKHITLYNLTYAIPNEELKKIDLTDETAFAEYKGPIIHAQVQLLDKNGDELIGEKIEQPLPCWSINDPRLLLRFCEMKNDEKGNLSADVRIINNEAGRKHAERKGLCND